MLASMMHLRTNLYTLHVRAHIAHRFPNAIFAEYNIIVYTIQCSRMHALSLEMAHTYIRTYYTMPLNIPM